MHVWTLTLIAAAFIAGAIASERHPRVRHILLFVGRSLLQVAGAIELETVLSGAFWGTLHGVLWYKAMVGPLHIKDYNVSTGTAVLIGATAYFERAHAQRTVDKIHERLALLIAHYTRGEVDERTRERAVRALERGNEEKVIALLNEYQDRHDEPRVK